MTHNHRSFPRVALVAAFLLSGIVIGVLLTARFDWTPTAGSAENAKPPVPPAVADALQGFAPIAEVVMPPVVNISTTRVVRGPSVGEQLPPLLNDPFFREFFGEEFSRGLQRPRRENSLGSGVIVSADGYIVTNYHVIAKADEIRVLMRDKREFTGKVVGSDPQTDIAVIKIDGNDLPVLPWGDSAKLRVGEYALAVGNPFGLNSTVTMGIVSAVGRAGIGITDYEDFIQTDAAINPGNSGGALVNVRGELIGINTAIFSQSGGYMGIGFAVPSNLARTVMNALVKTGKVTRGYLGVSIQEVTQDLAKQFGLDDVRGALVSDVVPGSPAAEAGLQPGDVIVNFNGKPIDDPATLRNLVAQAPIGETATLEVVRDGKRRTLKVEIAEQPKEAEPPGAVPEQKEGLPSALSGLQVRDLTPDVAPQLGLPPDAKGVVVTGIAPTSPAAAAGLQPGDVIVAVNRQPVRSVADLKRLSAKLPKNEPVLLHIDRGGNKRFAVIKP